MARTFADDLASDVANTFITDFAQSVIQWPLGVEGNAVTHSAVFIEDDPQTLNDEFGDEVLRRGTIHLPSTVTVSYREPDNKRDVWTIASQKWNTLTTVKQQGMQQVLVERRDRISTKQTRQRP